MRPPATISSYIRPNLPQQVHTIKRRWADEVVLGLKVGIPSRLEIRRKRVACDVREIFVRVERSDIFCVGQSFTDALETALRYPLVGGYPSDVAAACLVQPGCDRRRHRRKQLHAGYIGERRRCGQDKLDTWHKLLGERTCCGAQRARARSGQQDERNDRGLWQYCALRSGCRRRCLARCRHPVSVRDPRTARVLNSIGGPEMFSTDLGRFAGRGCLRRANSRKRAPHSPHSLAGRHGFEADTAEREAARSRARVQSHVSQRVPDADDRIDPARIVQIEILTFGLAQACPAIQIKAGKRNAPVDGHAQAVPARWKLWGKREHKVWVVSFADKRPVFELHLRARDQRPS